MDDNPIVLVAHVPHPAVFDGFLPACAAAGRRVLLLTDRAADTGTVLSQGAAELASCDVFNPLAIIAALSQRGIVPDAILSNSDHLQAATALAAQWFGLPGKDWRLCVAAKNKNETRRRLRALDLPTPWSCLLPHDSPLPDGIAFPVVAKPCEGVASLDVRLCDDRQSLEAFRRAMADRTAPALLLEAFMRGPLFTLETLGDGRTLRAVGGFDVSLSPPPHFVELAARWNGPVGLAHRDAALEQLRSFGIGFGVCHSEFIATETGPVLVEINYRSIGDGREFLLDRMSGGTWFRTILALHRGEALDAQSFAVPDGMQAEISYQVATRSGRIARAADRFAGPRNGCWSEYQPLRRTGDPIELTHSNKDYVGALRIIAPDGGALADEQARLRDRVAFEIEPDAPAECAA